MKWPWNRVGTIYPYRLSPINTPAKAVNYPRDRGNSGPRNLDRLRRYTSELARMSLDPLYAYKGRDIEWCLLTVGYLRSGSSLLGQFLNAHPEMVIAHEAHLVRKLHHPRYLPHGGRGRITRMILERERWFRQRGYWSSVGYSYAVKGQWQGSWTRLRVIGDKAAMITTRALYERPGLLDSLRRRIRAPIRVLFMCRNPYDMVASEQLSRLQRWHGAAIPAPRDYHPSDAERPEIRQITIQELLKETSDHLVDVLPMFRKEEVLPVFHEDFIASPKEKLREICSFCGVESTEEYLDACAAVVLPSHHRTRFKVRWSEEQKAEVSAIMARYSWFEGYGFES